MHGRIITRIIENDLSLIQLIINSVIILFIIEIIFLRVKDELRFLASVIDKKFAWSSTFKF